MLAYLNLQNVFNTGHKRVRVSRGKRNHALILTAEKYVSTYWETNHIDTRLICKNIPSSFSPNVPFSKLQLGKISFLSLQEMALFALKVGRIAPSIHFEMGFFIPNVL